MVLFAGVSPSAPSTSGDGERGSAARDSGKRKDATKRTAAISSVTGQQLTTPRADTLVMQQTTSTLRSPASLGTAASTVATFPALRDYTSVKSRVCEVVRVLSLDAGASTPTTTYDEKVVALARCLGEDMENYAGEMASLLASFAPVSKDGLAELEGAGEIPASSSRAVDRIRLEKAGPSDKHTVYSVLDLIDDYARILDLNHKHCARMVQRHLLQTARLMLLRQACAPDAAILASAGDSTIPMIGVRLKSL